MVIDQRNIYCKETKFLYIRLFLGTDAHQGNIFSFLTLWSRGWKGPLWFDSSRHKPSTSSKCALTFTYYVIFDLNYFLKYCDIDITLITNRWMCNVKLPFWNINIKLIYINIEHILWLILSVRHKRVFFLILRHRQKNICRSIYWLIICRKFDDNPAMFLRRFEIHDHFKTTNADECTYITLDKGCLLRNNKWQPLC